MGRGQFLLLALATALYACHAAVRLARLRRPGGSGGGSAWALLVAALLSHTIFLLSRGIEAGGLPAESRLDSLALFLWITAAVCLLAGRLYRLGGIASLFWLLFAAGALAMWALAGRGSAPSGSLDRFWLFLHLVPVYIGYAGLAAAAVACLTYLVQERLLRRKAPGALWRNLPSLETLERVDRFALALGFPLLTVGLVAGVFWAERSASLLGREWFTDPKVLSGMVVWLFYAAILHVRLFARLRGRRAAWLTIAGFLLAVASFATVHVYATGSARAAAGCPMPDSKPRSGLEGSSS